MGKRKEENIIGQQIGIFEVIYECDFKSNDGHRMFHVKCVECGSEFNIIMNQIKRAKTCRHLTICGINKKDMHWGNKRLRKIFYGMHSRCYDKKDKDYKRYGGKGIEICDVWMKNPLEFISWALNNGYNDNLTIDRIDSNGNYEPNNCRWISKSDNCKYKSTTKLLEVNGESHTGREWALILGLGTNTINKMLREKDNDLVKKFITLRIKDKGKNRKSKQTWFNVYGLE